MKDEREIRKRLEQIIKIQNETGLELKVDIGLMINDMSDLFDIIEDLQDRIKFRDVMIKKQLEEIKALKLFNEEILEGE